jgi:NAD(P)-dependent dehydrogenase (short-subunit alcohol dehydrogenase family)
MNNGRHSGEVALVTGANKGIGREIARRLAAEGVTVYLGARDEDRGRRAARDLAGDAADVRVLQLDVTDQAQIDAAVKRVDEEFGRLDVLVNNAGIGIEWGDAVEEVTVEQVRRTYEVNVFGVVAMTRACIPLLRRSAAARVVNLSSPLGSLGLISDTENPVSDVGMLAYSSSKTALNSVTLLYANALRKDGILVNAASPGFVATDLNDHRGHLSAEQGADLPAKLALLGADGSTGTFLGHPSGTFLGHDDSSVEEVVVPW